MRHQGVAAEGQASRLGPVLGLRSREALGGLRRPLPGQEPLVDIGGPDLESEAELLEQLPTPRRSGGEDESWRPHAVFDSQDIRLSSAAAPP